PKQNPQQPRENKLQPAMQNAFPERITAKTEPRNSTQPQTTTEQQQQQEITQTLKNTQGAISITNHHPEEQTKQETKPDEKPHKKKDIKKN
ncbi:hypothetical protein, partial [Acinetobacter baumannii]